MICCKARELQFRIEKLTLESQKQASIELIQNAPQSEDYSEILLTISRSLDNYSAQYIREYIRKNVSRMHVVNVG